MHRFLNFFSFLGLAFIFNFTLPTSLAQAKRLPDEGFFEEIEQTMDTSFFIGQFQILSRVKLQKWSPNDKGCLSQLINKPSLAQITSVSLTRIPSAMLLTFESPHPISKIFTKLPESCQNSTCKLSADGKNNLFSISLNHFEQGHLRTFKIELIPTSQEGWYLRSTHEIKMLGLFPTSKFSQSCFLRLK